MTKEEAVNVLSANVMLACDMALFDIATKRCVKDALDVAIEVLQERKTGKWISRKNELKHQDWWTCSECSGQFSYKWNYCPNCGADMRGKDNV